jgi:hypothetical protein
MKNYSEAWSAIEEQLQQAGWKVAPKAKEPLRRIDFAKLVEIHDHEEHFLEQTFINSLLAMRSARASTYEDQGIVTAQDVETALRMLGVAAARQPAVALSDNSKAIIKEACGFC